MIITYEFQTNCWLDLKDLTLGKSFMTLDIDFKPFG